MRLKILTVIIAAALFSACKKDNKAKPTIIEVTVQLQNGTILSNTPVKLLTDQQRIASNPVATGTSDASGKIDFTVTVGQVYYLYYDATSNKIINPVDAKFIVTGTFTSQQQINSSPFQSSTTKVGDPIYQDINGDGVINALDAVMGAVPGVAGDTNKFTLTLLGSVN
jgi:hypothetical protein